MSESAPSASVNQSQRERAPVPRYYLITAIIIAMILVLAGGAIYYRVATNGIVERLHRDNLAFAQQIHTLAERAATSSSAPPRLVEQAEAEMAARPVVKIRVYGDWRIRYSTNASEIGTMLPNEDRYYYYLRDSEANLTYYPTFETGEETLEARDMVVSRVAVGDYRDNAGIDIYADATDKIRAMGLTDAVVTGGLELLAVGLLIALRRRS